MPVVWVEDEGVNMEDSIAGFVRASAVPDMSQVQALNCDHDADSSLTELASCLGMSLQMKPSLSGMMGERREMERTERDIVTRERKGEKGGGGGI